MSSLKGLFIVLGITAFAGIGGLYALEELCERSTRVQPRTVRLPKYEEEQDEITEPYVVPMEDVNDVGKDAGQSEQNGRQDGVRNETNTTNTTSENSASGKTTKNSTVLFEFADYDDDDDVERNDDDDDDERRIDTK